MKNEEIKLLNPIRIDGKEVGTLTYNTDEITADMFSEAAAEAEKAAAAKGTGTVMEVDAVLHLHLGFQAIIAVNPKIDIEDLKRIKGMDIIRVARIGRNFITGSAAGASGQETSDGQSEITADSTTQEQTD